MKSIKEKAKKWCSEHSNKGCTEKCDGCQQLRQVWGCEQRNMETAYEAGANYVLDAITECMPKTHSFNPNEVIDIIASKIKELKK